MYRVCKCEKKGLAPWLVVKCLFSPNMFYDIKKKKKKKTIYTNYINIIISRHLPYTGFAPLSKESFKTIYSLS